MSPSPSWYLQQAGILFDRADECLRLAGELDDSPLLTLLSVAGDDTWQCPAAEEYRRNVLLAQRRILAAIDALRSSATGLGNEGGLMSRTAAEVAAQQRAAERAAERQRDTTREAV